MSHNPRRTRAVPRIPKQDYTVGVSRSNLTLLSGNKQPFQDQNQYDRYGAESSWKSFVLPQMFEGFGVIRETNSKTNCRPGLKAKITSNLENGYDTAKSDVFRTERHVRLLTQTAHYASVSPFELGADASVGSSRVNTQTFTRHNSQIAEKSSQKHRRRSGSMRSARCTDFGIQTDPQLVQAPSPQCKYTNEQVQLLKEQVLYLRRHLMETLKERSEPPQGGERIL